MTEKEQQDFFWADQLAEHIISRKAFHYSDKPVPKWNTLTVKTSASLSGVLHIGRLSDTIRGETAYKALKDAGVKADIIWVAEDMDPMRKIPKNVPKEYEKYLGMPVTDVPDMGGNFSSYAERFKSEYFEVIDNFVSLKLKKYSMRQEYKKGTFNKYIKIILDNTEEVRKIQNKYKTIKLPKNFSPWKPICDNCGKLQTTEVKGYENGIVKYECKDYDFETTTAKGCNHKGDNEPLKGNGKLVWKAEWAAQWAHWQIVAEGAGKEYQVPNSAWWVNAEICEHILNYPMPAPIFYEHLMIDGEKMSASLGNVVYPKDWLDVAPPDLLRFFYNKRLMVTRSFSWIDLPKLYDDYDNHAKLYHGITTLENKKEESHMKRLFEMSAEKEKEYVPLSFSHAGIIAQIFSDSEDIIRSLEKTGHYDKKKHDAIFRRIAYAKTWLSKYAPEDLKITLQQVIPKTITLTDQQKKALHDVAQSLKKNNWNEKSLFEEFYAVTKKHNLSPGEFFKAAYNVLLNKDKGPKLAPFLLALGKDKVVPLFEAV